jgi:hypothetical protein
VLKPKGHIPTTKPAREEPVRLLLARGAELTLDRNRWRADVQQLRVMGVRIEGAVLRAEALPPLPEIDAGYYQSRAAANTFNARLNEAAGRYFGDIGLSRKRDSLYAAGEFERLQTYLTAGSGRGTLRGVIYVRGGLALTEGQDLRIRDGALVLEGTVYLTENASLEITHSGSTRTLPGLVALRDGGIIATQMARLRVHGLV